MQVLREVRVCGRSTDHQTSGGRGTDEFGRHARSLAAWYFMRSQAPQDPQVRPCHPQLALRCAAVHLAERGKGKDSRQLPPPHLCRSGRLFLGRDRPTALCETTRERAPPRGSRLACLTMPRPEIAGSPVNARPHTFCPALGGRIRSDQIERPAAEGGRGEACEIARRLNVSWARRRKMPCQRRPNMTLSPRLPAPTPAPAPAGRTLDPTLPPVMPGQAFRRQPCRTGCSLRLPPLMIRGELSTSNHGETSATTALQRNPAARRPSLQFPLWGLLPSSTPRRGCKKDRSNNKKGSPLRLCRGPPFDGDSLMPGGPW